MIVPVRPLLRMQLDVPAPERINLEHAQDVIEQVISREDSSSRPRVLPPRVKKEVGFSAGTDPLSLFRRDIGSFQPVVFPDTMKTTELERNVMSSGRTVMPYAVKDSVIAGQRTEIKTVRPPMPFNARKDGYPPASVILILLGMAIFFTSIRYHFGRNLYTIIRAFFSYYWRKRIQTEKKERDRQAIFYANLFSFLVTGIVFSFLISKTSVGLPFNSYGIAMILFTLASVLLLFFNISIWQVFGNIFLINPVVKEYIYNLYLCNAMQGIVIFPLTICIPFINNNLPFILTIVGLFVLIYIFRFFRFFQIIHTKKLPVFYFILYLCSLEILPFIVLIKSCMSFIHYVVI